MAQGQFSLCKERKDTHYDLLNAYFEPSHKLNTFKSYKLSTISSPLICEETEAQRRHITCPNGTQQM